MATMIKVSEELLNDNVSKKYRNNAIERIKVGLSALVVTLEKTKEWLRGTAFGYRTSPSLHINESKVRCVQMEQKYVTRKKNNTAAKDSEAENLLVHKQKGNTIIRIFGDSILPEEEQQRALEKCKDIG